MATIPTQIRIDAGIKEQANGLFHSLGLDMSTAVNLFLHQCVLHEGLPFQVEVPRYTDKTLKAADEARKISRNASAPGYTDMQSLKAALES